MAKEPEDGRAVIRADELPRPLEVLRYGDPQNANNAETIFYVLGTAHVSLQSCRDAADLIARVRPDFVLLELCNERISILSLDKFEVGAGEPQRLPPWTRVVGWNTGRHIADLQANDQSVRDARKSNNFSAGTKLWRSGCCDTVRKEHPLPGPVFLVAGQGCGQPRDEARRRVQSGTEVCATGWGQGEHPGAGPEGGSLPRGPAQKPMKSAVRSRDRSRTLSPGGARRPACFSDSCASVGCPLLLGEAIAGEEPDMDGI